MPSALLVRFRPAGPWRLGPDNGAPDRTDRILHSDAVYSAVTLAMRELGWLEDWIAATATAAEPLVRLTSCYAWTGRLLMVEPPRSMWPVSQSGKLRWKSARFVPASLIPALVRGEALKDDQWAVDPVSECLLPVTRNGPMHPPFRVTKRRFAAVDRETGASESAREVACLQFAPSSGMWFGAVFASDRARDQWTGKLRSACRLLADVGLGGGRSMGWGKSDDPRFETVADWNRMLTGAEGEIAGESAWWLLSLFTPAESDAVDWKRGNYGVCVRSGRVASTGELKRAGRMVAEGSVLLSGSAPAGVVRDVAPEGSEHPVYRSGLAVAVPIPWKESRRLPWMTVVAEPEASAEDIESMPEPGASAYLEGEESPAPEVAPVTESGEVVAVEPGEEMAPIIEPVAAEELPKPVTDQAATEAWMEGEPAVPAAKDSPAQEPPVAPEPVEPETGASASLEGEESPAAEIAPVVESGEVVAIEAGEEMAPIIEPVAAEELPKPVADQAATEAWMEGEPAVPAAEDAPVQEPPAEQPPAEEPPVEEPPAQEPPSEEPPVTEPPTEGTEGKSV